MPVPQLDQGVVSRVKMNGDTQATDHLDLLLHIAQMLDAIHARLTRDDNPQPRVGPAP